MRKRIVFFSLAVISLLLVVAIIIAAFKGISVLTDSLQDLIPGELGEVFVDTTPSEDVTTPSDKNTTEPHVLRLGDPGLTVGAVNSLKGDGTDYAVLGFVTDELKLGTTYKVTWKIDPSYESKGLYIGNTGPTSFVRYASDYNNVVKTGYWSRAYFPDVDAACNNTEGILISIPSEQEGSTFIGFFYIPFLDTETVIVSKAFVAEIVTELTFVEVIE